MVEYGTHACGKYDGVHTRTPSLAVYNYQSLFCESPFFFPLAFLSSSFSFATNLNRQAAEATIVMPTLDQFIPESSIRNGWLKSKKARYHVEEDVSNVLLIPSGEPARVMFIEMIVREQPPGSTSCIPSAAGLQYSTVLHANSERAYLSRRAC